ncbi:MAG: RpiB/LacA/LacB family sugar-phosphate isomerase [bacterium]|nr:RpiB/LacA/LacB family sugar-phosphate isomerase [bacterium]
MKIAVCSDEPYPIHDLAVSELTKRGHEVVCFGSLLSKKEESWVQVACQASKAVSSGKCDEGIFFCWTGTGVSMVANKICGIRAALCTDAETAKGARIWNHANVLCLSNRLMTPKLLQEILEDWFLTPFDSKGEAGVEELQKIDQEFRK